MQLLQQAVLVNSLPPWNNDFPMKGMDINETKAEVSALNDD